MRKEEIFLEEKDRKLFGRYEVRGIIGTGYSGTVYLAEHIRLNALRAIKKISKTHIMYEQFLKEAALLKNLKHPGIPIIYDMEEDEESLYIIEEYIEGESLQAILLDQKNISNINIINYGIQICSVIEYLHGIKPEPVLYLDLKPQHIIICHNTVKIIDFGTAVPSGLCGQPEYSMGTPGYAAPEQYGMRAVDEKADIYAIGAVLRQMAAGTSEEDECSTDFRKKKPEDFSVQLKKIISRAMETNPENRYGSVAELRKRLCAAGAGTESAEQESSLIIAVTGSQPRMGSTHLSVSLTAYLNRKGYRCICEERNSSGMMQSLLERNLSVRERAGVYELKDFSGLPEYGKAVISDVSGYQIKVRDYGAFTMDIEEEVNGADVIIALLGTKEWEIGHAEKLLQHLDREKTRHVFNFGSSGSVRELAKSLHAGCAFRMPFYADPFARDRMAEHMMEGISKRLFSGTGRGRLRGK